MIWLHSIHALQKGKLYIAYTIVYNCDIEWHYWPTRFWGLDCVVLREADLRYTHSYWSLDSIVLAAECAKN